MPSTKRKFGDFGEKIALRYLESKGYRIIDRNFERPWGEIDIVAQTKDLLVFCEVKTRNAKNVQHYLAEYSVNHLKIKKLQKMCETYLAAKHVNYDQKWRIDVIAIEVDEEQSKARIKHYKNAVWEKQY